MSPSIKVGHHHLRVDRPVCGGKLIALLEVQEAVLRRDVLQVQRDADAEARLRPVVGVKLHLFLSSGHVVGTQSANVKALDLNTGGNKFIARRSHAGNGRFPGLLHITKPGWK
jgi:hypothetical protein